MPSATADTNIYISGIQFGKGPPRQFLELANARAFRLDISAVILAETLRVLRDKFEWEPQRLKRQETVIRSYTNLVAPTENINAITVDPTDNHLLECAVTAQSDFIVSGDVKHVLPLVSYNGIPIVTVAEFVNLLSRAP